MRIILVFCLLLSSLSSCKDYSSDNSPEQADSTEKREETRVLSTADSIALAHGYDQWNNVQELRFTWNIDRADTHFERSFVWKPKTSDVSMIAGEDTITYNRNKVDSLSMNADRAFINDAYWLLAPFNIAWDEGVSFQGPVLAVAPISGENLNKLTVTYTGDGGYTPGDAYDLYYGEDYLLKEWVYRRGNQADPTMATTWEEYTDVGGLRLATMHQDSTGGFKLYFTGLEVKKN
jgi:hypothetical protein